MAKLLRQIREDDYHYMAVTERLQTFSYTTGSLAGRLDTLKDTQRLQDVERERMQGELAQLKSRLDIQQRALQNASDDVSSFKV